MSITYPGDVVPANFQFNQPCPHCGKCPTCGRGGAYDFQPWVTPWQPYPSPFWYSTAAGMYSNPMPLDPPTTGATSVG